MIYLKRVYEEPREEDGLRILVERLWPRGLSKQKAQIDLWAKDLAPSGELRLWFSHDLAKWAEFIERYKKELQSKKAYLKLLQGKQAQGPITLVYAAKDQEHNSAVVLKSLLE